MNSRRKNSESASSNGRPHAELSTPVPLRLPAEQRRRHVADAAVRHLRAVDLRMHSIIEKIGPHRLIFKRDPFITLVGSIISQQISMAAAASIQRKVCTLFDRGRVTADGLLALPARKLRSAGLSMSKVAYMRDLAGHFADGRLTNRKLRAMNDDAVIEATTAVKGIGRWTAEMLLIFCLERPDVWPVDDLGIRKAVRGMLGREEFLSKSEMAGIGEPWRPYRSYASWYLWRSLEGPLMPGVVLK